MPYSKKQRTAAAIAEHDPGKLYKRNRGFLKASKEQLHDIASGPIIKAHKHKKGNPEGVDVGF